VSEAATKNEKYKNEYGTFLYTVSNNNITITGYQGSIDTVYIPKKINDKTVTNIASKAFVNKNIKRIFCTSDSLKISENAFYNCSKLTYANFNYKVTVNDNAFSKCSKLSTVICKYNSGLWKKLKGKVLLISSISETSYTGKKIKPLPKLNYKGISLVVNKNYKLTYSKNVKYGTGKCKVKFIYGYKKIASKTISFYIRPSKTQCSAVSVNNGELRVNWEQKNNVDGYYVTYSTNSKFLKNSHTVKIKGKTKTSYTCKFSLSQLKSSKMYYVRVRSYKIYKNIKYTSSYTKDKVKVYPVNDKDRDEVYTPINYEVMKGMWVSYIDLCITDYSYKAFKNHFNSIVSNCKSQGYNTLIVQVRPFNDAVYYSDYFPYSHIISGEQGKDPGYDALKYMISKAHSAGLSFHCWINPYRVTTSNTPNKLSSKNPYSINTSLGVKWDGGIYLNPAKQGTENLIVKGIVELMKNYEIDGIQFDDYFYPTTSKKFDADSYKEYKKITASPKSLGNWRKSNVNKMVKQVYSTVKNINVDVVLGISPQGNYDNNALLYADVKSWCTKKGYVDYICPQIYWSLSNPTLKYETALKKWMSLDFYDELKFYVGLAGYKAGSSTEDSGTWKNQNNILKKEYLMAVNDYLADGVIVFRYENLISSQAKKEFKNLSSVLKE
jgi:uncharacterized lipoprotein YddW (UPF0748 family)